MRHTGLLFRCLVGCATLASPLIAHAQDKPQASSQLTLLAAPIASSNLARSVDFYSKGLGLKASTLLDRPGMSEQTLLFPGGGAAVQLQHRKDQGSSQSAADQQTRLIIRAPDVRALAAQLSRAGYALSAPVQEIAQLHVVVGHVRDPDGNMIELVQGP